MADRSQVSTLPLQKNWTRHVDTHGKEFFYNDRTGLLSYTKPEVEDVRSSSSADDTVALSWINASPRRVPNLLNYQYHDYPVHSLAIENTDTWHLISTERNLLFFYHLKSKYSTWYPPRLVVDALKAMNLLKSDVLNDLYIRSGKSTFKLDDNKVESKPDCNSKSSCKLKIDSQITPKRVNMTADDDKQSAANQESEDSDDGEYIESGSSADSDDDGAIEFTLEDIDQQINSTANDMSGTKLSIADQITKFNELLTKEKISPYATFETVLPKLQASEWNDLNLTLTYDQMRKAFDQYCKHESSLRQTLNDSNDKINAFSNFYQLIRKVLEKKALYWPEFKHKYFKDPKFIAFSKYHKPELHYRQFYRLMKLSQREREDEFRRMLCEARTQNQNIWEYDHNLKPESQGNVTESRRLHDRFLLDPRYYLIPSNSHSDLVKDL